MPFRTRIDAVRTTLRLSVVVATLAIMMAGRGAGAVPDFAREVHPILEKHCLKCHGPEKQKGGLRFDTREGAFKDGESGEKAFVPGHAKQSRLIKLISSKDKDERMPPKGEALSAMKIALLKSWIDAGAEWPERKTATNGRPRGELVVTENDRKHWSYLPLK